jgi:hypothetical protein
VNALECRYNVFLQRFKGAVCSSGTANQNIVESGVTILAQCQAGGFAQPAADTIAQNSVANLLGTGESDARQSIIPAGTALQDKARHGLRKRLGSGQEIPPMLQTLHLLQ